MNQNPPGRAPPRPWPGGPVGPRRLRLGGPRSALARPFPGALLVILLFATPPPSAQTQAKDSLPGESPGTFSEALTRARRAQDHFEDLRRRNSGIDYTWIGGRCDARVGRMCWRHHTVLEWRPTTEPDAVREARDTLLRQLAAEAEAAVGDPWILGQRIRYLLEAGREGEALGLARGCGGAPTWWCEALEGLALHVQGLFPEAEEAFRAALGSMDPEEARHWTDPSPLLDGSQRDFLREVEGGSLAEVGVRTGRLWGLADPLYLVPGNDRYTEHLARRTMNRILAESATPHEIRWGDDMAELLLRYGWELGWARIAPRPGELGGAVRVVGYEHPDVRRFLPPEEALSSPTDPGKDPWTPSMWPNARSGYAPSYAPTFLPAASRILQFTRGERALVAATFRLPPDTTYRTREAIRGLHTPPAAFDGAPIRSAFLLTGPEGEVLHSAFREGEYEGVLILDVPAGDYVASTEVLDPAVGRAGRRRVGLRVPEVPPDLPFLSDLFLVEGEALPTTTLEGLSRLSIDGEAAAGEPLLVGWELWGLGWTEEVLTYRLSLERSDPGILDRVRGLFGGGPELPSLVWEEPGPSEPGPAFHSISLAGQEVDPGEYILHLEVRSVGREPLTRRGRIRILEAGSAGGGVLP